MDAIVPATAAAISSSVVSPDMIEPQNDQDEQERDGIFAGILNTPPKLHKPKDEADAQDKKLDRAGRGPHSQGTD